MILGFTLRKREGYHSCLSLMAFRIKPPIIAIGIETEKETGSRNAPRTPPRIVHMIARITMAIPPQIRIDRVIAAACHYYTAFVCYLQTPSKNAILELNKIGIFIKGGIFQ